ncbi:MAG: hypothetical protein JKX71_04370 [Amylibacter sp.]|nr:hypothetical protein [Amylibacter sp.]
MAVFKGNLKIDPRGMIYEAYRIENIVIEECRMIFLDWAMHTPQGDMKNYLQELLSEYEAKNPSDHPMTEVIKAGFKSATDAGKRRGGRMARVSEE